MHSSRIALLLQSPGCTSGRKMYNPIWIAARKEGATRMADDSPTQGIQTRLIHHDRAANESAAVSPPIYQTSTFLLGTPEQGADLAAQIAPAAYYTRYGSPNTKQVEALL